MNGSGVGDRMARTLNSMLLFERSPSIKGKTLNHSASQMSIMRNHSLRVGIAFKETSL